MSEDGLLSISSGQCPIYSGAGGLKNFGNTSPGLQNGEGASEPTATKAAMTSHVLELIHVGTNVGWFHKSPVSITISIGIGGHPFRANRVRTRPPPSAMPLCFQGLYLVYCSPSSACVCVQSSLQTLVQTLVRSADH